MCIHMASSEKRGGETFYRHCNELVVCFIVAVSSFLPPQLVSPTSSTCSNDVCDFSCLMCLYFPLHFLECMEHNRQ